MRKRAGVVPNTAWNAAWLVQNWPGSPLRPLPPGAEFTVAFGPALRIGAQAGQPLEDLGVMPTGTHRITRRDLLEDDRDLRIRAGELLAASDRVRARLDVAPGTEDGRTVLTLTGENVDGADVYVNGRPVGSAVLGAAAATVEVGPLDLAKNSVRAEGFTGSTLTAARTLNPPVALA